MKTRLILFLLLLALLLTACGSESAGSAPTPPPGTEPEATPEPLPVEDVILPSLSLEESRAMARFLNANRALLLDGALYCYDFDENWAPVLARYTLADGALSGFTVLAEGCIPEYLCSDGTYLFYIDRASGAIERVSAEGGEREALRQGPCTGLALREGRMYFCDGEGRCLSLNTDGGDETLLLEGPCSFAYPLEGGLLYRDETDGGRLHLLRAEDGRDFVLTPGPAATPLLYADRLWYDDGEALCSLDRGLLDERRFTLPERSGDMELLPGEDGLLLRGILDADGPRQWAGPIEGPFEQTPRGYRICDWLGGGVRVDTLYEPDGRIRCYVLTDEADGELSFLAGQMK